jgi:hypothetical protein
MDCVGDQQDRDFHLLKEPLFAQKAVENLFLGLSVKARENIIQNDQFLLGVNGARQSQSLFLATT